MFKRNKLSLDTNPIIDMDSALEDYEKTILPGIATSQTLFQKVKKAMQDFAEDPEVRAAIKKAAVGIAANIAFSLIVSGRYKLLKTAGVLVVGAVVLTVKKRKERKRLAGQNADVLEATIIS